MKKTLFMLPVLLFFATSSVAQEQYAAQIFDYNIAKDFAWGDYEKKPLDMTSYNMDPKAEAVVLKELGRAWITSNGSTSTLIFDYHVKIKLFNTASLKRGHIELPYYIQDNGSYEEIRTSGVQGITYYKEPNGAMHAQSVDPDSITIVKVSKHLSKVVFNMPKLSPGCIIEYKYRLESPFLEKFKTWEFQADIPKVYSEYEVHIPQVFGYNVAFIGPLKLSKDTTAVEKRCFASTNLISDCTIEDYEIKDVPAFVEEPYMRSPKNFISALHFQLTEYDNINNFANLNQAMHINIASDWSDVDKMLRYNDNFGSQLNKKSIFKTQTDQIVSGKNDSLIIAKSIYAYIQKTINFNGQNSIYSEDGIKKAIDKHTGNVADINLALVAALNEAGIKADAVIISTRANGTVNKLYPALSEFNYVIAVTNIHGKDYLLDATEPTIQFGMLPIRSLNDQGRVVPLVDSSYWINLVTSQQKTDVYTVDLTLNQSNSIIGTFTHYSKSYAAYEQRKLIKSFKTTDDYVKSLILAAGYTISKFEISNLDKPDLPLTETYTVQGNSKGEAIDPFIFNKLSENPFKSDSRKYDIDMVMPLASSYTATLHLPDGMTVDTSMKRSKNVLPNSGGGLTTKTEVNGNIAIFTEDYQLSKPVFSVAEYPGLKSMYEDIVTSEKTPIKIIKK